MLSEKFEDQSISLSPLEREALKEAGQVYRYVDILSFFTFITLYVKGKSTISGDRATG